MTGPGKTGLIYTKYTCLYYGTYLLFCMCYPKLVNFIAFLMDFCIYDDILGMIQITDKKLLHVKLSKLGQILHVDKTCFPRPSHIFCTEMNQRLSMDNSYTIIPEYFSCKILTDLISFSLLWYECNTLDIYIATATGWFDVLYNLYILYIYSVCICIPFHCLLAVTSVSTRISHCL